MQFGIFTVSDITEDPTTGSDAQRGARRSRTPSRSPSTPKRSGSTSSRSASTTTRRSGRRRRRRRSPTSPPRPSACMLSTATTLITTNDPVKIAEDFAMLQHVVGRPRRPHARPRQHRPGVPVVRQGHPSGPPARDRELRPAAPLWREDVVDWEGKFRTPLQGFTSTPRPLDGVAPFVWHGSIRTPEIAEQAAYYGDGFFANNIFWPTEHYQRLIALLPPALRALRARHARAGDRRARRPGVHARRTRRMRCASSGRTSTTRRSTGTARRSRTSPSMTPLTVGSPQQVIDRYAGMREHCSATTSASCSSWITPACR